MKKGLLIAALLITLVVAVLLSSVALAGGVRFDFQIEPGCVVEITPLNYWYKDANGAVHKGRSCITHDLGRKSWADYPPFRTLHGEQSVDVDLWCPGIAPTYQGTIHIADIASGHQDIWFPLQEAVWARKTHDSPAGVFYTGWWVTIDAEKYEALCDKDPRQLDP